jgi:predicted ester cyclase
VHRSPGCVPAGTRCNDQQLESHHHFAAKLECSQQLEHRRHFPFSEQIDRAFHDRIAAAIGNRNIMVLSDEIYSELTFEGVHTGEFNGVAPTGKAVKFRGIAMDRIENGKIVDIYRSSTTISHR